MSDDLILGGDPVFLPRDGVVACDDEDGETEIADLSFFAWSNPASGAIWSTESDELNANLIAFEPNQESSDQVNLDRDVLLVGVMGEGVVEIDGAVNFMWPGTALLIPRGASRVTRAANGRFAYLTCSRPRPSI
jgi:quercetin dioxygenase-like cupin family protein